MTLLLEERLLPGVAELVPELVEIRHDLHQHPELGFDTERTCGKIVEYLRASHVDSIDTELVKGCVIAVINGDQPGHTIGVRSDMDALPMKDGCGKPYASVVDGRGHCCGHDGHTTWLLGVARWLASHRDFPGRVVLVFQAAEEPGLGAKALIEAGLFEKYGIEEIYGGHTEPNLPKGTIGFKPGPLQAASDSFYVTLKGKGTHGGRPHLGVDPMPVAAQIILALQTIVARKVDPIESAVVSVCSINAGNFEAVNVVQSELTMSGTVRTFLPEIRDLAEANITAMVNGIAAANGCEAELVYDRIIGSVINAEEQTEAAIAATRELLGEDHVKVIRPFMSSEDFSRYLNVVPGSIIRVGIRDDEHCVSLHHQKMDFNDDVLPVAVSVVANMAVTRLKALA
ncbi:MAG: amidohydrolase [Sutterella wadsworthensis]|nr:amidohydrolase [Sutterella wadsworthensis]